MNKKDMAAILTILKVAYPFFYRNISESEIIDTVNVWTSMFENDDPRLVTEAVKALIQTHKDYPPTIAHVKEKIRLLLEPNRMTELEAWTIVNKAIKDSYYNSARIFEALPEQIKAVVRVPEQLREWGQMDSEVVNSVVASNFMRSYKAHMQHENTIKALPESTRELISTLKSKMLIEG